MPVAVVTSAVPAPGSGRAGGGSPWPAPPVEAEVLSWDNPIEATLVEEPRPRRSLSKRISDRMRGRL